MRIGFSIFAFLSPMGHGERMDKVMSILVDWEI